MLIDKGLKEAKLKNRLVFFTEAIELAEKKSDDLYLAYFNRGVAYHQMNQHKKAAHDFDECLTIKPEDINALQNSGLSHQNNHDYVKSIARFSKIILKFEDSTLGYFLKGNVFLLKKDFMRAILNYNTVLKLDPFHKDALNNRAWAFFLDLQYVKALEDFDRILKNYPDDPDALKGRQKLLDKLDLVSKKRK